MFSFFFVILEKVLLHWKGCMKFLFVDVLNVYRIFKNYYYFNLWLDKKSFRKKKNHSGHYYNIIFYTTTKKNLYILNVSRSVVLYEAGAKNFWRMHYFIHTNTYLSLIIIIWHLNFFSHFSSIYAWHACF